MPVNAFISRDPSGNPWPPVHEHEATAAIGLIQRLHEALNHERTAYAVLVNLQAPSADLLVITEMGVGVIELKHYPGALSVQAGEWYAGTQLVKSGVGHHNPRAQAQSYASRIRKELIRYLAKGWSLTESELDTRLKIQTAVCFSHPDVVISTAVKEEIERDARQQGQRWSAFQLLTPADFPAWVGGLRFGIEKDRSAQFAPQRLTAKQITGFAELVFKCSEWTEIKNLMPTGSPYAYLTLRQAGQEPILFPLRTTEVTVGRDGAQCQILVPEAYKRTSRAHARITRVGSAVMVTDLSSSHGTYVNGNRVATSTGLRAGQRITLGGAAADERVCELQFTLELPPEFQAGATARDSTAGPS
jgi:hypothetical protein